jgi:hypothetical protein
VELCLCCDVVLWGEEGTKAGGSETATMTRRANQDDYLLDIVLSSDRGTLYALEFACKVLEKKLCGGGGRWLRRELVLGRRRFWRVVNTKQATA